MFSIRSQGGIRSPAFHNVGDFFRNVGSCSSVSDVPQPNWGSCSEVCSDASTRFHIRELWISKDDSLAAEQVPKINCGDTYVTCSCMDLFLGISRGPVGTRTTGHPTRCELQDVIASVAFRQVKWEDACRFLINTGKWTKRRKKRASTHIKIITSTTRRQ